VCIQLNNFQCANELLTRVGDYSCDLLCLQFDSLDTLYKILTIAILICMIIIEVIRIYIGYVGNLSEKVKKLPCSQTINLVYLISLTLQCIL